MSDVYTKVKRVDEKEFILEPAIKEMMDAGVFYGRTRNKTNPRMKQHILANRNGVEIINVEKTKEMLDIALDFIKREVGRGVAVMLVGTQPASQDGFVALGKEFSYPAVTYRWLGGTLTNY